MPFKNKLIKYSGQGISDADVLDEFDSIDEISKETISLDEINSLDEASRKDLVRLVRRLQSLFDTAPDGILTLNLGGYITSANKTYYELTGFTEEEIIGKHFTKLGILKVSDVPKYLKMLFCISKGIMPDAFEFEYMTKKGEQRWGEARVNLVKIGTFHREIITILRDVTELKRIIIRQKALMQKLEQSNKELEKSNEDLEDFTYAVSHDLKSPLRTITAFADFLIEDYSENLDETGKEYLLRMKGASIRMKRLIDDLLNISRVGRMNNEFILVDLNKLIMEIRLDFENQLTETNSEIIDGELPSIMTQKIWIQQLFSNLISNGLKFNKSPAPKVWIDCEDGKDHYLFSVRDNGIGIESKDEEKIFKIFHRLHNEDKYPGTGAGLTICRKIVESFGGRIWVVGRPGEGSTFYFTLPKRDAKETEVDFGGIYNDDLQIHEEHANGVE